jgi:hypothetical protein
MSLVLVSERRWATGSKDMTRRADALNDLLHGLRLHKPGNVEQQSDCWPRGVSQNDLKGLVDIDYGETTPDWLGRFRKSRYFSAEQEGRVVTRVG